MASGHQIGQFDRVPAQDGARRERPRQRSRMVPRLVLPQVADDQIGALDAGDLGVE